MHVCSHRDRGADITWGTYNAGGSPRSDWACVKVVTTGTNSDYIRSIVKPTPTTCIRVTTTWISSTHNKFEVTTTITWDNIVVVTRTKCNPSTNNYTIINRGIIKVITNSIYNRKSNNASFWSIGKAHCRIDKVDFLNH
jgi:hypothetical protein